MTIKVALVIEYDGTRYHGFQWQDNAPTIQKEVEIALAKLIGRSIRIRGASRTDAGAHAKGQVVSFQSDMVFPVETWVKALNFYLPEDIAVKGACSVDVDFDVRRDAIKRHYRYHILNRIARSSLMRKYVHPVQQPLDIDTMNKASECLVGEHDFASFSPPIDGATIRRIFKAAVHRKEDLVIFDICGNSFLPHQVRTIVGSLIKVGLGKMAVDDFQNLVDSVQAGVAGPVVPACGLCLMEVVYPSFPLQRRNENL